jgi:hypothetical protein
MISYQNAEEMVEDTSPGILLMQTHTYLHFVWSNIYEMKKKTNFTI